jgi:hypothetical protein
MSVGTIPDSSATRLLLGAVAFAGSGGGQNLCQSNWIRDKGFGMGQYVPRLVSPVTGDEQASAAVVSAYVFEATPQNLGRWRRWWRFANVEQIFTFALVSIVTICLTSMLAHSTLFGEPGCRPVPRSSRSRGGAAGDRRRLVRHPLLDDGCVLAVRLGHGDRRLHEPPRRGRLKSTYLRESPISESRIYFWLVWGLVAIGCAIILAGLNQPMVLLVMSACVGGTMMFLYSGLLIQLNTQAPAGADPRAIVPAVGARVVDRLFRHPGRAHRLAAGGAVPVKALLLTAHGTFALAEMDAPAMTADEVLVRVRACGVCGSDVHGYRGATGRRIPPLVMGHEASGVVDRIGDAVTRFAPATASRSTRPSSAAGASSAAAARSILCDARVGRSACRAATTASRRVRGIRERPRAHRPPPARRHPFRTRGSHRSGRRRGARRSRDGRRPPAERIRRHRLRHHRPAR